LYSTKGLRPGLPTGRGSNSAMSRSRFSSAGMREAAKKGAALRIKRPTAFSAWLGLMANYSNCELRTPYYTNSGATDNPRPPRTRECFALTCSNCQHEVETRRGGACLPTLLRAVADRVGDVMRACPPDEHWKLLGLEYCAQGRATPWLDRTWYRVMLAWLRWRMKCARRREHALVPKAARRPS
jgi:hypothetical protein